MKVQDTDTKVIFALIFCFFLQFESKFKCLIAQYGLKVAREFNKNINYLEFQQNA